jgi:predicted AlkP superfamily pyrophosphatase or phosphodiesterase
VAEASRIIESHRPTLLFVHFPEVDATGHRHGWGSAEQLTAIEQTDVQLGELLQAFVRAGIRESTVFILSADHGGTGLGHGPDDPRSRYIPWIAHGPGIRTNFDLTQLKNYDVNTEDTAATALHVLGIALLPNFDGKPVMPAFLD